jgi:predicted restriction endonuclease
VAHIAPVRAGGRSVLGNLLVLCPNHHKEFDLGDLEIAAQTPARLAGRLNGVAFAMTLEADA